MLGLILVALCAAGTELVADASGARKPSNARKATTVQLKTRDAVVATGRTFELALRCPGSARSCDGHVAVRELRPLAAQPIAGVINGVFKSPKPLLATSKATLDGGIETTVSLELTRNAFARVRTRGPLSAQVVMSGRDATGRRVRLKRTINIAVPSREKEPLLLGVVDDRIQGAPGATADVIRDLGLGAVRVHLIWQPGQGTLSPAQIVRLGGVVNAAPDLRVVVTTRSHESSDAPTSRAARDTYCSFVGDLATRFPEIRDFGIWLEPNKQKFWAPQYDSSGASVAPAAYSELLARCWDVLHRIRADANVIGPSTASKGNDRPGARSNVSHSPGAFIRAMGASYRASGRTAPILDTVGHHPYGEHSAEPPGLTHARSNTLGLGDWAGLLQAVYDGFAGTGQPTPGPGGPQIWYTESGFQTTPSAAKAGLYSGAETDPHVLSDKVSGGEPDQATQLRDAIELAYCQPYVTGLFDFLLYDEADLGRWQSGLFWADETPKASAASYAAAVSSANERRIDCSNLAKGSIDRAFVPKTNVGVTRIGWAPATQFNHKHDLWRLRVQLDEPSHYVATIVPVRRRGTRVRPAGDPVRTVEGTLRRGYYQWVKFPRKRLAPGLYRIELKVTSSVSPDRTARLDGPPVFEVRARRTKRS